VAFSSRALRDQIMDVFCERCFRTANLFVVVGDDNTVRAISSFGECLFFPVDMTDEKARRVLDEEIGKSTAAYKRWVTLLKEID
jgi:hypothetical protein